MSYPYDAEVVSPILGSGSESDHSGYGNAIDPDSSTGGSSPRKADEDHCFTVTIIGDSIVEDASEYIVLQVDFGDVFVHNITLIIVDDDSKCQYRWMYYTTPYWYLV